MPPQDILIVKPASNEQLTIIKAFLEALQIKFEYADKAAYAAEVIAKVQRGRQEIDAGKGKTYSIEQLENLWK